MALFFPLSLIIAFLQSGTDLLAKVGLGKSRVQTISWVRVGWSGLLLLPLLFFAQAPSDPAAYWKTLLLLLPLEVVAILGFHKSLQMAPIALTIPFLAFTPVFLIGTGWLLLGEVPNAMGLSGIFLVTLGAFFLQKTEKGSGLEATRPDPFSVFKWNRGTVLMLGVAFIYSVTSSLAKKAILLSSPLYFAGQYYALVAACLLPFQWNSRSWARELVQWPRLFAGIAVLEVAICLLQFYAIAHWEVAYVIAIKRLSLLLTVLYGRIFLKEGHLLERAGFVAAMIAGAALIALSKI